MLLAEAEKVGRMKSRENIREGRHAELKAALHIWVGNDVASLRNIERQLFIQKCSNTNQTKINSFFNNS